MTTVLRTFARKTLAYGGAAGRSAATTTTQPQQQHLRHASILPGVTGTAVTTTGKPLVQHTAPAVLHPQLRRILEGAGSPHQHHHQQHQQQTSSAMKARWSLSEIDRMMVEANRVLTALRHEKAIKDTSAAVPSAPTAPAAPASPAASSTSRTRARKTRRGVRHRGRY